MPHERGPLDVLANPFAEVADTDPGGKWVIAKAEQPDELYVQLPPFVSKFMVLELLAAGIVLAIFIPACRRIAQGGVPRGRLAHGVEAVLLFIRDEVAIPTIGEHHYRKFLHLDSRSCDGGYSADFRPIVPRNTKTGARLFTACGKILHYEV